MVQWIRLRAPNAEGLGSVPGQGTRSHMLQLRFHMLQLKKKKKKKKIIYAESKRNPATVKIEDLVYSNKDTALPLFFKYGNKILHDLIYLKGCANVIDCISVSSSNSYADV